MEGGGRQTGEGEAVGGGEGGILLEPELVRRRGAVVDAAGGGLVGGPGDGGSVRGRHDLDVGDDRRRHVAARGLGREDEVAAVGDVAEAVVGGEEDVVVGALGEAGEDDAVAGGEGGIVLEAQLVGRGGAVVDAAGGGLVGGPGEGGPVGAGDDLDVGEDRRREVEVEGGVDGGVGVEGQDRGTVAAGEIAAPCGEDGSGIGQGGEGDDVAAAVARKIGRDLDAAGAGAEEAHGERVGLGAGAGGPILGDDGRGGLERVVEDRRVGRRRSAGVAPEQADLGDGEGLGEGDDRAPADVVVGELVGPLVALPGDPEVEGQAGRDVVVQGQGGGAAAVDEGGERAQGRRVSALGVDVEAEVLGRRGLDQDPLGLELPGDGGLELDLDLEVDVVDGLHDPGRRVVDPGVVLDTGGDADLEPGVLGAAARQGEGRVADGVDEAPLAPQRRSAEVVGDEPARGTAAAQGGEGLVGRDGGVAGERRPR